MQVNAVSSQSFGNKKASGKEYDKAAVITALANANDRQLRQMAVKEASIAVNDKKHNRINSLLYWSLPVAAGLAAVARNPVKGFSELGRSSRFLNLKNFASTTLGWAASFAAIEGVIQARNKVAQNNDKVRDFDRKHPFASVVATLAVAVGVLLGAGAGVSKLASKIKANPKYMAKLSKFVDKFDKKLVDNKLINKVAKGFHKIPSAIKGFGKGILEWTPLMLFIAQLSHSARHSATKNAVAGTYYGQLKSAQANAREILAKAEDKSNEAEEV